METNWSCVSVVLLSCALLMNGGKTEANYVSYQVARPYMGQGGYDFAYQPQYARPNEGVGIWESLLPSKTPTYPASTYQFASGAQDVWIPEGTQGGFQARNNFYDGYGGTYQQRSSHPEETPHLDYHVLGEVSPVASSSALRSYSNPTQIVVNPNYKPASSLLYKIISNIVELVGTFVRYFVPQSIRNIFG